MGLFDKVGKLFGGGRIDEKAIQSKLAGMGVDVKYLSVIAFHEDHKVAVVGRVSSEADRSVLIDAARQFDGVQTVEDRIQIESPAPDTAPEPETAPEPASAPETTPAADSEAAAETKDSADAASGTVHTVQPGDTLSAIAKQYYGDASQYMKIFEANQPPLEDPNKIFPGQELKIPPKD